MSTRRFFSKPELRPTLSLHINETTKESLLRRARAQSERERRAIKPSQVARALLEYALTMVDERASPRTS